MEGQARTWFTPKQRAELWERWKSGQCVADIARALERRNKRASVGHWLPHCGALYSATPSLVPNREGDTATCVVCHKVMDRSNTSKVGRANKKPRQSPGPSEGALTGARV